MQLGIPVSLGEANWKTELEYASIPVIPWLNHSKIHLMRMECFFLHIYTLHVYFSCSVFTSKTENGAIKLFFIEKFIC